MTAGGAAWRWAPLLAAIAVAVAWRGGYTDDARGVVAALAGLAALAAVAVAPEAAGRAPRHPIVLSLAALAVLTALTAAWTTGAPSDAARDAAAILALCAVVVAAASMPAPWAHGGVLLAAAVGSAISGLAATVATSEPLALDLCGSWRPSGPFEYPPALALVCASALPVALCVATECRRALAVPGALAAWLLVVTVALTANRTGIGLCALAATGCVALAPRTREAGPVALATIGAAAASALLLHGDLARASDGARVAALLPALVLAGAVASERGRMAGSRAGWTALVAVASLLATTAVVLGDRGSPCGADPSHGRVGIWRAALHTAAERPVQGFGPRPSWPPRACASSRSAPSRRASPTTSGCRSGSRSASGPARGARLVRRGRDHARARAVAARTNGAAWLLAPAVAAFPLANVLDWPWALTGAGALWALALGGLLAWREQHRATP